MTPDLIGAGHALSAFARRIANESIACEGASPGSAAALSLAEAWEAAAGAALPETAEVAIAYMRGRQHGQAARDELLDLAADLAAGFAAALDRDHARQEGNRQSMETARAAAGLLNDLAEEA